MRDVGGYFRRWRRKVETVEKGGRRIGRVGGLVVDWVSASSRGLGRSMDGGEGAVRCESVCVRKRRYRLAQGHVFKKARVASKPSIKHNFDGNII